LLILYEFSIVLSKIFGEPGAPAAPE
jgi:hypothetical protein